MNAVDLRKTEGIPEGLSLDEVERLRAEGKVNAATKKVGKSYLKIITDNLFTYFNLIWAIVTAVLILCNSFENMTFLAIIIPNVTIAILQEMRAKHTVEKLSVTTDPKATVIRGGELMTISADEIVLGDVMLIEIGKQVLSDAVVISGLAEANESMITGESDAIKKEVGDKLLAGSFLVGGSVYAKVVSVGADNYVHKIETAAKSFKAPSSNLFRELSKLIKGIGVFLIPMAITLFVSNLVAYKWNLVKAAVTTCASIVGMIPSGMYLLVTVTLTLSVIALAKKKTLVRDMYSIEMLASADVVCLDKTGTITDGTMHVTDVVALSDVPVEEIERIMSHIEGTEQSINNTSAALIDRFGKDVSVKLIKKVPFSSTRKYSAVDILGLGAYSIGAPHFVPCPVSSEMDEMIESFAKEGKRVLLLCAHEHLDSIGSPLAFIAISDRIRPGAKDTIASFQSQGVTLKVISGDHAATVSTIARSVGIYNAEKYLSCEDISNEELVAAAEEYAVFGRVTPEQKVLLVKTLKKNGHTVAMTGDGVNDTLALKESNCAIAMADGSEMACKVANIVLLNSDFTCLPSVVREGRKCINNVRQSSVLFLMKTLFTILLSIISVVTMAGYPFEPKQFLMLELFVIGLASVLLALEPNNKRIEGSFLDTVITKSLPDAIAMLLPILSLMVLGMIMPMTTMSRNSIATIVVTLVGYMNLIALCSPINKWRGIVLGIVSACLAVFIPVTVFLLGDVLGFKPAFENPAVLLIMMSAGIFSAVIMQIFRGKVEKIIARRIEIRKEHEAQRRKAAAAKKKAEVEAAA